MNHPNQTDLERIRQTERRRALVRKALTYMALALWALMVLFPFYWMLLTSVKSYGSYNAERIPALFTLSPTLENYKAAFTAVPLGRYLLNTLVFTVLTTAIMAAVSILAAYAFARLEFKGKNLVFLLFLSLMMIPNELVVITNFATITVTILKIIECWNSYVWPRLVTDNPDLFLVSNGIQEIRENGFGRENIPAMMAAVVVISVPLIVLFLVFRKKIMEGVSRGGMKG